MTIEPTISNRGFAGFEPIVDRPEYPPKYQQRLTIYESSNAMGPHVWVSVSRPYYAEYVQEDYAIDLTLRQAQEAIRQLQWFVDNHYQVKDR